MSIPLMRMASHERVGTPGLLADDISYKRRIKLKERDDREKCNEHACTLRRNHIGEFNRQISRGKNYIIPPDQVVMEREHYDKCNKGIWHPSYNETCPRTLAERDRAYKQLYLKQESKGGGKRSKQKKRRSRRKRKSRGKRKSRRKKK